MTRPISHFAKEGVRFEYESTSPGVPQVYGPPDAPELYADLKAACVARKGLPRKAVRNVGDCLFCDSTGLTGGALDCELCRLARILELRDQGVKI